MTDHPSFETLDLNLDGGIAHVALNRPDKLNAMNNKFFTDLKACFEHLASLPSLRVVILSGNGKHFTAGLDLMEAASTIGNTAGDPSRVRERLHRHIRWMQSTITAVEACPVPVIAAVHGACLGGGVDLTTACDIRITSADAYFTIQEIEVAIVADLGTLQRIPHLLPLGVIKELAYTGRKMGAEEAKSHGFVNSIHADKEALMSAAFDLAGQMAAKSPTTLVGTKRAINQARDHSVADGLEYVAAWNSGMLLGEDLMKASTAVMAKNTADFKDRYGIDN